MDDNSAPITLRTRGFINNRLLGRRQFVLDILHPSRANVPKAVIRERLAALYQTNESHVVVFGLRTCYGGGQSTGFALIYDDVALQVKFDVKHRLERGKVIPKVVRLVGMRNRKNRKNYSKKFRGKERARWHPKTRPYL